MAQTGQIARGTVVRILLYGALVRLDDGCLGLVHISEIDARYVRDVREYVAEDARVVVKVLGEKEGGRFEFSIKQAHGALPEEMPLDDLAEHSMEDSHSYGAQTRMVPQDHNAEWAPSRPHSRAAFDEKLREFLADSSESLSDVRRHTEDKLHLRRR